MFYIFEGFLVLLYILFQIGVIHGIQLAFQYMDINNGGHGGFVINMGSCTGELVFNLERIAVEKNFFCFYWASKHILNEHLNLLPITNFWKLIYSDSVVLLWITLSEKTKVVNKINWYI